MITSIIFDMDDLMVNTSQLHFAANDLVLKDHGIAAGSVPGEFNRKIYGMRMREIMELLIAQFNLDADVDTFLKKRNQYFMTLVRKGVGPMPGLEVLLKNVKRWKRKSALATSGIQEYADEVLKQLNLENFFEAIVTGDQVKNPKPAPDCFLLAAKRLRSKPNACAVLEDSTHGITAAKKAGMLAIAVENSVHPAHQDLSMADILVHRLDEITKKMLQ